MTDSWASEASVGMGGYEVVVSVGYPPAVEDYRRHAHLHEHFDLDSDTERGTASFVAIRDGSDQWPSLVVTQRFSPSGPGFPVGVLLAPETARVFIGAGTRLLAYAHDAGYWRALWVDTADFGFWGWRRHGRFIVMAAELELAVWTVDGNKLWSAFVEPPWEYRVEGTSIHLDVMGTERSFPLASGPSQVEADAADSPTGDD